MEVFGSSGIRGVANRELTPAYVARIAAAAGSVWGTDRVALGRDTRETGEMFADAAAAGLAGVGCDVDRLGVVPTPGVQTYAAAEGIPALVVTASHNPPEYNGLKLIDADGVELTRSTLERVEERLVGDDYAHAAWDETGRITSIEGARRSYVEAIRQAAAGATIAEDLTVALDPGHGAGALTSPQLFRALGCEVVTVNGQPDGRFPGRDPEPVAANLADLARTVRAVDADIGIAHDGDADRAIFLDERGEYVEGDAALAALTAEAISDGETVVSAVNVSQRLVDVVDDAGASLELTPIGSTHIVTAVRELLADGETVPIAGEGNGGILFPDYRLARDGAYTAVRFIELLGDRSASAIVAPHDGYANVRVNVGYDSEARRGAMLAAADAHARQSDATVTTVDGYRLDYGDAWVLVRPSGTEPLVRIYAEAPDPDRATALAEEVSAALETAGTRT